MNDTAPMAPATVTQAPRRLCGSCGGPLTGRRVGALYCSSACKARAYNLRTGRRPASGTPVPRRWFVPLAHPGYCIEPCPRCGFPEADGGACANCGWTLARPGTRDGWTLHPPGTVHGPVR